MTKNFQIACELKYNHANGYGYIGRLFVNELESYGYGALESEATKFACSEAKILASELSLKHDNMQFCVVDSIANSLYLYRNGQLITK
jgi:hypothetical protein